MTAPEPFDYARFLESRYRIDERSLDRRIWQRLMEGLGDVVADTGEMRVLEIGSGTGAMAARLCDACWDVDIVYTFVDELEKHNVMARARLESMLGARGYRRISSVGHGVAFEGEGRRVRLRFETGGALGWLAETGGGEAPTNLLVGQAVLDLFDVPSFLDTVLGLLKPGGLFYFPTTYDGLTLFGPEIDRHFDEDVSRFYDWTMDERARGEGHRGGSRSGRIALETLAAEPLRELDAAGADWIVLPSPGGYAEGVRYFLEQMIGFVAREAVSHPDRIDQEEIGAWVGQRYDQIREGRCLLMARHLDIMGRK